MRTFCGQNLPDRPPQPRTVTHVVPPTAGQIDNFDALADNPNLPRRWWPTVKDTRARLHMGNLSEQEMRWVIETLVREVGTCLR